MISLLPELLRRAAAAHPNAVAVRDTDSMLTYKAFMAKVYRLARYLQQCGCDKGAWVAVCLPRGVDAVVAQAAIMAAGCVFVPVDPTYPPAVLAQMLQGESALRVVGYRVEVAACLQAVQGIGIVLDDSATAAAIASLSGEPLPFDTSPEDGAYVIHTSGSSGIPKGVLVSHKAIAHSTLARWERYPGRVNGFLMVSPMFFDSSLAGIWWTLSQGGLLELGPRDPAALLARLRFALTDRSLGLSHTLLTPTFYSRTLDALERIDSGLSHIIVAGETCSDALVRRHYGLLPNVELVNEYGPTEAGVWCSSAILRVGEEVTIGTAIANVELMIVDPDGRPLPMGAAGELAVAGEQLAECYPHDARLTAQRFVPHPALPGRRMYRTGDRAWQRPDGQFSVSGRLDEQVKIRGFRVDLEGVRSRLGDFDGIAEIALLMQDRGSVAGPVLTAYVVPQITAGTVEKRLRETWTDVVDEVAKSAVARGTDFDISGWNSSYTGKALNAAEMAEWVESTVALMREHHPASVLDLGCGSGLPLLRVAPHCERYVGLDVSTQTLEGLQIAVRRAGLHQVDLQSGEAADVARFREPQFNLVVSNSVSQYFPNATYLTRLIESAQKLLLPGGRILLGDVRDLGLLEEFHTVIGLARAAPEAPASTLLSQIAERVEHDTQLVISPRWFAQLAELGLEVEVRPRRGRKRNEMNDFRFDAILYPAADVTRFDMPQWLDWTTEICDLDGLRTVLRDCRQPLGIRRIPNARTAGASAVLKSLRSSAAETGQHLTVRNLQMLRDEQDSQAVHPEALFDLAAAYDLDAYLDRGTAHAAGALDVVFRPRGTMALSGKVLLPRFDRLAALPTNTLITDPSRHRITTAALTNIVPALRRFAEAVLAPQERPGAYMVLSALPMTRQGKVDKAALPVPEADSSRNRAAPVAPTSETEKTIAAVWWALLGIEQVGIDDDFVELGGDSLLAAACAVRLSEQLNLILPAGVLFAAPTIRSLALLVDKAQPRIHAGVAPVHQSSPARLASPETGIALPLTSAQTVFWFLDHYRRPGSSQHPDFALAVHYRISGPLDVQAMSDAIDQLVQRHEALRTSVHLDAAEGTQTVLAAPSRILRVQSVAGSGAGHGYEALQKAARHDADIPLDPANGRVFTAQLTSASVSEHLLILRVHHIVADGWSIDVMESELEELYDAALRRRAATLAPSPSYQNVVEHMDRTFFVDLDWREAEPYRSALRYWARQVEGVEPSILKAAARDTPSMPTQQHSLDLTSDELDAVLQQARQCGATLFSTIVAALACLRAQDSGNPDVRLLTLNAARDTPGLDRMVGLLLNPMLLRLSVQPGDELADVLPRASAGVREALAHGQVPLLAMCEEIPDLMSFMTESQFVGVELLSPARGLRLADCDIVRTDPFDDEFLGRRFELPVELLLVVRRSGSLVRLTVLYDPAVVSENQSHRLLARLRDMLLATQATEVCR